MDRRSTKELEILEEKIGTKRVYEITGNRLDTYFTLTELMWFLRNHPDMMKKCHKILQVNGYINYKLTEVFSIDATHASLTQLYDVHNNCWSEELFEAIGGDTKIMPDIYDCMDVWNMYQRSSRRDRTFYEDGCFRWCSRCIGSSPWK